MSTTAPTNEQIADYVSAVLSGAGTDAEKAANINAAAQQYGVSREQLAGATNYGLDVVNKYLGSLPAASSSPLSTVSADNVLSNQGVTSQSPLSLLSADEQQQSAIDSATVKPQDTAGYYRGVQIPTFTDRTVYHGGGEDAGTFESAAQQLASWQTEQDRRAALTPAQRAIEDARYDLQGEGSTVTAYNTVIVDGKEYTVTGDGSNLVRISDNQSGLGAKQTRYDMLDPVTGKITQEIGVEGPGFWKSLLTNPVTGLALGLLLPGASSFIGSALGATTAAGATALGSGVLNFGLQVAAGADPIDALKGAVLSAGAGFAGAQVSSMLPAELAAAGKNAVTQLITTGKLDPAALATSVGTSFATDALAAETGVDRATAGKLVTAGLQAFQGNELAALTSLAQAGLLKNLTSEQLDIAGLATAGQESLDAKQDLAIRTFTAAKNAGATDAEAIKAANVAVGLVANPRGVITTDISGTPTGKDEFVGFDNALKYAQALASGALEFEGVEAAQKLQNAFKAGSLDYTNYDLARLEAQLVGNQPSLEKAREAAETLYGKGASFNYNGKLYETTKPDSPSVAATQVKSIDTKGATEWELSLMRTPLGFDANNATTARIMSPQEFKAVVGDPKLGIDPNTLDQRYQAYLIAQQPRVSQGQRATLPFEIAYRPPSATYENPPTTFDEFKNTVLGGVAAGSKVASGAQNVVNSLVTNLTGTVAQAVAGATSSFTGDPSNVISTNLRKLGDVLSSASDVAVPELAVGAQNIAKAVDQAKGFDGKVVALGKSVLENPGAALWWGTKETTEELVPLAIAAKVLKLTGNVGATAAADAFTNFVETQGLTQEELQKGFIDLGLTPQQAAQASSPGAFAQGAAEGLLSPLWEIPAIKAIAGKMTNEVANLSQTLGSKVGTVTKAGAGETIKEGTEEMAGEAAKQFVMTGGIDPNAVLTAGVIGGPLGGKASSTITGIELSSAGANADLVSKLTTDLTSGADLLTTASTTIGQALGSNVSPQTVVASTMLGTLESGQSTGNAVSTVITAAIDNGLDLSSTVSMVVNTGIQSGADAAVVTDTAIKTALSEGGDPTTIIASAVSGASSSPATVTTAVASSIATALSSGVDPNAAVKAATDAATKAGTSVQTDVKSDGSVITTTATDGNTSTTSSVDVNTGTSTTVSVTGNTTTQVDTNSNSTVTTTVTSNSSTTTEIDNNTGVTTKTAITTNTLTSTVIDPNAATKTETKTDLTTGQTVTVVTDIKTNTQETLPGGGGNDTLVISDTTLPGGTKEDTLPGTKVDTIPGGTKTDIVLTELPPVTIDTAVKTATPKTPPTKSTQGGGAPAALLATGASGELGRLLGQMLEAKVTDEKFISPLAKLPRLTEEAPMNIDPRLERYLDERGANPESNYYSYGKVPSLDEILGGQVMAQGGEVMPLPFMYAKGGLSRQDFRQGKHVSGPGDGQSDDIPAMLADGEFVFPADVVAALGNGSTKAGTEKLYQMMHAIRQRARSTKVKDLPPPALKSPLDYLKSRK